MKNNANKKIKYEKYATEKSYGVLTEWSLVYMHYVIGILKTHFFITL